MKPDIAEGINAKGGRPRLSPSPVRSAEVPATEDSMPSRKPERRKPEEFAVAGPETIAVPNRDTAGEETLVFTIPAGKKRNLPDSSCPFPNRTHTVSGPHTGSRLPTPPEPTEAPEKNPAEQEAPICAILA